MSSFAIVRTAAFTLIACAISTVGNAQGVLRLMPPRIDSAQDRVTVPIELEGAGDVSALDFRVQYDPSQLKPVGMVEGASITDANKRIASNVRAPGEYVVVVSGLNQTALRGSDLAEVVFERLDAGESAVFEVKVTETTLASAQGALIESVGSEIMFDAVGTELPPPTAEPGPVSDNGSGDPEEQPDPDPAPDPLIPNAPDLSDPPERDAGFETARRPAGTAPAVRERQSDENESVGNSIDAVRERVRRARAELDVETPSPQNENAAERGVEAETGRLLATPEVSESEAGAEDAEATSPNGALNSIMPENLGSSPGAQPGSSGLEGSTSSQDRLKGYGIAAIIAVVFATAFLVRVFVGRG